MNCLMFKTRTEWRRWLENNHLTEKEAWLIHYKRNASKSNISYEEAVEEALCFGWIDSKMKRVDDEKYILRYSPRRHNSPWSEINKQRAIKLIDKGKMNNEGMNKITEAKRNGKWSCAYSSKKSPTVPLDLKRELEKNKDAWNNFNNFTNSYKTSLIYWVNNAKRKETRIRRINEVFQRSIKNKKQE